MKKNIFLLVLNLWFVNFTYSQDADSTQKKSGEHFELSFGQSVFFISQSQQFDIVSKEGIVVPTNAILFFGELKPKKKLSIPLFFNLATETKQFVIDSVVYNEKASPTFGFGLTYKPFHFNIGPETRVDFEIGPLASFIFDRINAIRVAPVLAARFRILRGKYFSMYLGASYSFGIGAFGLLYGTGSLF